MKYANKHSIEDGISLGGIMWWLFEILCFEQKGDEEMLRVWRRRPHWGCHGGCSAQLPSAQMSTTTTLLREAQNLTPSLGDISIISHCFSPQSLWRHVCGMTSKRKVIGWGEDVERGGEVGPTSGRLDRSRLKGARPCLGLPAIHTTFISVCFLAMSSSNIGVCIYMIVKSGRVETFKKSF